MDDDFAKKLGELVGQFSVVEPAADDSKPPKEDTASQPAPDSAASEGSSVSAPIDFSSPQRLSDRVRILEKHLNQDGRIGDVIENLKRMEAGIAEIGNLKPLFGALHAEMKTYKDDFLFDTLQRPMIMDLIALQDDIGKVGVQIDEAAGSASGKKFTKIGQNLGNCLEFLAEILRRLAVQEIDQIDCEFDAVKHRALETRWSEETERDAWVVEVKRPGYFWRGRVLRPADVVLLRKGKNPTAAA